MVARLIWLNMVWLKWRLLVNGLRHDRQRLIGFPILIGFVAFGAFALAARFMDTAEALPSIARGRVFPLGVPSSLDRMDDTSGPPVSAR